MQISRGCLWESIMNTNDNLARQPFAQKGEPSREQEERRGRGRPCSSSLAQPLQALEAFPLQTPFTSSFGVFREWQSLSNRKHWNSFCKTSISLPLVWTRIRTTMWCCWTLQRGLWAIIHNTRLTLVTFGKNWNGLSLHSSQKHRL